MSTHIINITVDVDREREFGDYISTLKINGQPVFRHTTKNNHGPDAEDEAVHDTVTVFAKKLHELLVPW